MDERGNADGSLISRIEQLQHERDELRKDIEQLCLQQAGPSYLSVTTRMHFQRTAGLEQEIESLKKKLAGCTRDKQNLEEELAEAYRIKSQLADLHNAEVLKNKEAEKQLKFFQSSVAAAFSERDHALMECEKAKEMEEAASDRLTNSENRVKELQSLYENEKKLNADLQMELTELKEKTQSCEKVINKFYGILQKEIGSSEVDIWQGKCSRLLDDPSDNWIFNSDIKTSTSKYIASLEEQLEKRKNSMDNLQSNLRMGLQIEKHLKKCVQSLERKQILLVSTMKSGLSALRDFHNRQRSEVFKILEEETSEMKSVLVDIQEKLNQIQINSYLKYEAIERGQQCIDAECRDVHITSDVHSDILAKKSGLATESNLMDRAQDASETLAQALQEKVAVLLLLSQEEERHLLERDVNHALQKKMEELQRNLSRVTNEKVQALLELAQLKRDYQLLQESCSHVPKHGKSVDERSITLHVQEGKLKNLLKRSYLRNWTGKGLSEETNIHGSADESGHPSKKNVYPADYARLKVENAALQESMANLEHLTSSIHRLCVTLLKARDEAVSSSNKESITEALRSITAEAVHVKIALGSSLPVTWSADSAVAAATYENLYEAIKDPVSSAGLEMVNLVLLAAQLIDDIIGRNTTD